MKRIWRLQFSLRTYILGIVVIGILLALFVTRVQSQKQTVNWVEQNGGYCLYDFALDGKNAFGTGMPPEWAERMFGVDAFASVQCVDLSGCEIDSLNTLIGMHGLESLYLNGSNVVDLGPLAKCTALREICLEETNVVDISPLCELPNLNALDIFKTKVNEITELASLTKLKILCIPDDIDKQQIEFLKKHLPNCKISTFVDGYWIDL